MIVVQLMPLPCHYSASVKSRMVYPSDTSIPRLSYKIDRLMTVVVVHMYRYVLAI